MQTLMVVYLEMIVLLIYGKTISVLCIIQLQIVGLKRTFIVDLMIMLTALTVASISKLFSMQFIVRRRVKLLVPMAWRWKSTYMVAVDCLYI